MKSSDEFRASVLKALERLVNEAKTTDFNNIDKVLVYENRIDMFYTFMSNRELELHRAKHFASDTTAEEQK